MRCRALWFCKSFLTALLFTVVPATSSVAQDARPATQPADVLQSRLDRITTELQQQMREHDVPGLGLAVVRGDDILLCTGLGKANLEDDLDATGDTMFAIGSSTKAFTATLVGMLIDDGVIESWDARPHEYLPEFHLRDEDADAKVTFRDLLSHNTGLSRMGLLWAAGRLDRSEIISRVQHAELLHPFRSKFNYSNINYIVAGEASARAADTSWDDLLRQRLLDPLNMNDSTTSVDDVNATARLARGYRWNEDKQQFERENLRDIASAAPAGAIYSSPREMANWLRFQLARGAFNGTRLISEATLTETWEPHTEIAPGTSYGLGWMISQWQGRTLIQHGGNIDGYATQVAFLPDENIGYVLLSNTTVNNFQATANPVVFSALLEQPGDDTDGESIDYTPYLGKYIADFGPFTDEHFTVQVKDGNLAVDVPGQMVYELRPPDDEGKWKFAVSDAVAVSFIRDDEDKVIALNMHQGGYTFELPREGVELKPEVALSDVRDLLGEYFDERLDANIEIRIENGRLAADVPGQTVYKLHTPDDDGRWVFRITDELWINFNRNDQGDVESMTLTERGQEFVLPRVESDTADDAADVPTLDEVVALHNKAHGTANLDTLDTYIATGTIDFVHQGVTGTFTSYVRGVEAHRLDIDLGRLGEILTCTTADYGWSDSSFDPLEELEGEYLKTQQRQHPLMIARDFRDVADELDLQAMKNIDGRPHYALHMKLGDRIESTIYIDAETGMITSEDLIVIERSIGPIPMTARYSDYRDVQGVQLPFRIEVESPMHGKMKMDFETIKANAPLPEDVFARRQP